MILWTILVAATLATSQLSGAHIVAHLDLAAGQQPENIVVEPDGSADLTLSFGRQVARVTLDGHVRVLGTVPAPPAGTQVPLIGRAFVGGIVREPDGTLYFLYAAGTSELTGLWRLPPGGTPVRVAALPADSVPNGLAQAGQNLYVTDSSTGEIWRIPLCGTPSVWLKAPELAAPAGKFGANGARIHDGTLWVTNFYQGTLMRIPLATRQLHVVATGLGGADDLAVVGNDVLVAANPDNLVELVHQDDTHSVVLTKADGLENPTAVAVRGDTVYVTDAAYFTGVDPNLLVAHLS